MIKFEVTSELMQRILDYIGTSTSSLPIVKVINLVDEIRALKPIKQEENNEKTDKG